jgi:branched-chain amino acid transport system permease protein
VSNMSREKLRRAIQVGLIAGLVALSISAIGMVEAFDERDVVTNFLSLGQVLLYSTALIGGFLAVETKTNKKIGPAVLYGFITGLLTAVPLIGLIILTLIFPNIRDKLVNVSPTLIEILTFGQGPLLGSLMLLAVMASLGIIGALFNVLPQKIERPVLVGMGVTLVVGTFSGVIQLMRVIAEFPSRIVRLFFSQQGIWLWTAVIIFIITALITAWWQGRGRASYQKRRAGFSESQEKRLRRTGIISIILLAILFPWIFGPYHSEVFDVVGLFALMGLGLNIVVGFAGLLDLGYVAFFAIGAYVMGLLTTTSDLGIAGISFWAALPIAVLAAVTAGVILGVPVLRMRGDYLAIVTLGFGEIIRVLALSDLMKPVIGGAQGILNVGKPEVGPFVFVQPEWFYYLILAGVLLAAFVSGRLRDARLGRRWMAMREDEDVAEATGIHLVTTKLLAFAIGAGFSGLAGAIFASRLSSIFPHSFNLLISINVLCLIIVGGLGSLPGVVLGSFILVGVPLYLSEFTEYRLLIYGVLLIATMLLRPEGLWPSAVRKRELHAADEEAAHEGTVVHREDVHSLIG